MGLKQIAVFAGGMLLCMSVAACSGAALGIAGSTSIFNSLTTKSGEKTTAEFNVYLNETEADFLVVDLAEDVETSIRYTYSTNDQAGVTLGYSGGTTEQTEFVLPRAPRDWFNTVWEEETVLLHKGETVFYLKGADQTCKMYFELAVDEALLADS